MVKYKEHSMQNCYEDVYYIYIYNITDYMFYILCFFIYFLIYQAFIIKLHTVILLIFRIHGFCLMLKSLCRVH